MPLNSEIQCILAKSIFFSKQQTFCIFLHFKTSWFKLDDKLQLKPNKKYKNWHFESTINWKKNWGSSFKGRIRLNLDKIQLQGKYSCHVMPSSNYQIKLNLSLINDSNKDLAAHMCAFGSFSYFKNTQKLVIVLRLF